MKVPVDGAPCRAEHEIQALGAAVVPALGAHGVHPLIKPENEKTEENREKVKVGDKHADLLC